MNTNCFFKKKTDPSKDIQLLLMVKRRCNRNGEFFYGRKPTKDIADKNKPKYKALVRLLKLNKLIIDLFIIKEKNKSINPHKAVYLPI